MMKSVCSGLSKETKNITGKNFSLVPWLWSDTAASHQGEFQNSEALTLADLQVMSSIFIYSQSRHVTTVCGVNGVVHIRKKII